MKDIDYTIECNYCGIKDCQYYKAKTTSCAMFLPLEEFKLPMLTHLMSNPRKAKVVYELLKRFNIVIKEIEYEPYFKLVCL